MGKVRNARRNPPPSLRDFKKIREGDVIAFEGSVLWCQRYNGAGNVKTWDLISENGVRWYASSSEGEMRMALAGVA